MKKKVIYIQEDTFSCGAECIRSIVSYYGGYVPLDTALDDTQTNSFGTNAYALTQALEKYGFMSFGRKVSLDDIAIQDLPVIAHVVKDGLEHFVVIYEMMKDYVVIMDPAVGQVKIKTSLFASIYDEKAIYAIKNGEMPHYEKKKNLIHFFLKQTLSNKNKLIFTLIICFFILSLNILNSFHFKILQNSRNILLITVLFLCLRFVSCVVSIIKERLVNTLVLRIDKSTLEDFTKHIFYLPLKILKRKKTGQIIKKIGDMSFVKEISLRIVITNSLDFIFAALSVYIMASISNRMTKIYLLIAGISFILTFWTNKIVEKKNTKYVSEHNEYAGIMNEYIGGIESVKNLNREDYALKTLSGRLNSYLKARKDVTLFSGITNEIRSCLWEMGLIISNYLAIQSLDATFTFYDLITLQSIFGLFNASLESILTSLIHLAETRSLARSVSDLVDIEEERQGEPIINGHIEEIRTKNLSFAYDGVHKNIDHFNLIIPRGEKILIKGQSGAGKSTLVKCLAGVLNEYEGNIFLDDLDMRTITKREIRSHIIYIGQEERLFTGTIASNIMGPHSDEEKLARIIEEASLHDVIAKRRTGLQTGVLEGAENFSGGERARIILARALYEEPDVLIIDETLSSLDGETEDSILKRLLSKRELTLIYITHREKKYLFDRVIEL